MSRRNTTRLAVDELESRRTPATFVVTSAADTIAADGQVTLREAMTAIWRRYDPNNANIPATPGISTTDNANTINFNIPNAQNAAAVIALTEPLPPLHDQTTIDGYSQPGASRNTAAFGSNAAIRIEIDGSALPAGQGTGFRKPEAGPPLSGIVLSGLISGLSVYGFADAAFNLTGFGSRLYPNNELSPPEQIRENNVQLSGNFIGVKADGATVGTPKNGVGILSTLSSQVVIGGSTKGDRNVISNSVTDGIRIENQFNDLINALDQPLPQRFFYISNNLIGTTPNGLSSIPNGRNGVRVIDSQFVNIGAYSVAPGADPQNVQWSPYPTGNNTFATPFMFAHPIGNVISGNGADGVAIVGGSGLARGNGVFPNNGTGIKLYGNLIGIGADDKTAVSNGGSGVLVDRSSEVNIEENVISDNKGSGVSVVVAKDESQQHNYILKNQIGLDSTGKGSHGNFESGVAVRGPALYTRINNNVIGNNTEGILLSRAKGAALGTGPDDVQIRGNVIGYESDKTTPAPNDIQGIIVTGGKRIDIANDKDQPPPPPPGAGMANAVGVTIIGANGGTGIELQGEDTSEVTIDMAVIRGNGGAGVFVGLGVTNVTIGTSGAGTEITGNLGDGIRAEIAVLSSASLDLTISYNIVSGNTESGLALISDSMLGTTDPGAGAVVNNNEFFDNDGDGITVTAGGSHQFTDNLVYGNDGHGIYFTGDSRYNQITGGSVSDNVLAGFATTHFPGVGNTSRGTTYSNNGALGIDRGDDGVTGDGMPVLLAIPVPGGGWRVNVSIQREPLEEYTIEFFDNMYVDPSGYGEGQYLYGAVTVTTDETGFAEFEYPTIFPAGFDLPTIRATATGNAADGWTSEFSTIDLAPPITVTGRVWWDDDADGIQDTNETNTSYGWVALFDENDVMVAQMPVEADGSFLLTAPAGTYRLYASQASFVTSPQDQGGDDELDSDVDAYGYSDWFTLDPDETIDLDVGMVYML